MVIKELFLFTILRSYFIQKKEGDFAEKLVPNNETGERFFKDFVGTEMD
jgi:hypothetical protein